MSLTALFLLFAIICAVWALVSAILITRKLDRRGMKTPFPWIGILLFRNLGRYKEVTQKETGKVGALYNSYAIPINTALIFALLALINNQVG